MKLFSYPDNEKELDSITTAFPVQFLKPYTDFYRHYYKEKILIAYSESLQAFMPVRLFSSKIFRFAQILHAPAKDAEELEAAEQKEFFNDLVSYAKQQNLCDRFIQSHPCGIVKAVPDQAKWCPFGSYINDLTQPEEEIYKSLNEKYRQAVGAAAKGGAVVKYGKEVLKDFYSLYTNTMTKAKISYEPYRCFESLYEHLGASHVETSVVYDHEQPIGSLLVIYSGYAAFVTHAGSGGNSKLYGAVKLLHFEMMKSMKARGVKRYDLVGVRLGKIPPALEGVFRFKKGFGGNLKEGFLWKKDIHPAKIKLYDLLMRINGIRSADIIDQSL